MRLTSADSLTTGRVSIASCFPHIGRGHGSRYNQHICHDRGRPRAGNWQIRHPESDRSNRTADAFRRGRRGVSRGPPKGWRCPLTLSLSPPGGERGGILLAACLRLVRSECGVVCVAHAPGPAGWPHESLGSGDVDWAPQVGRVFGAPECFARCEDGIAIAPLTLSLSPRGGERGELFWRRARGWFGGWFGRRECLCGPLTVSLSPGGAGGVTVSRRPRGKTGVSQCGCGAQFCLERCC